jgi:hypothetical protein
MRQADLAARVAGEAGGSPCSPHGAALTQGPRAKDHRVPAGAGLEAGALDLRPQQHESSAQTRPHLQRRACSSASWRCDAEATEASAIVAQLSTAHAMQIAAKTRCGQSGWSTARDPPNR